MIEKFLISSYFVSFFLYIFWTIYYVLIIHYLRAPLESKLMKYKNVYSVSKQRTEDLGLE